MRFGEWLPVLLLASVGAGCGEAHSPAEVKVRSTAPTLLGDDPKQVASFLGQLMTPAEASSNEDLSALLAMGDQFFLQGDLEQAFEFYSGTLDLLAPLDRARREDPEGLNWKALAPEARRERLAGAKFCVPRMAAIQRFFGEAEQATEYESFLIELTRSEGL